MKCIKCSSSRLQPETTEQHVKIAGRTYVGHLQSAECQTCGESYVDHVELAAFERAVARYLAEHGPATGPGFRYMRKAIGMPAKDLAALLSTAPETISRWENNVRAVDAGAFTTLGSIVLDEIAGRTTTRDRLRQLKAKRPAKRVAVKVAVAQ